MESVNDDSLTFSSVCAQTTRSKSGSERDEATQLEVSNILLLHFESMLLWFMFRVHCMLV